MPFGVNKSPVCGVCKTTSSILWRKGADAQVLCLGCSGKPSSGTGTPEGSISGDRPEKPVGSNGSEKTGNSTTSTGPVRKSARIKPKNNKLQTSSKLLATKGKNRRVIFKKNPIKAPTSISTVVTSDFMFYEGIYWQIGDIVSAMDEDNGKIYYAQIRGFLQDQYCNKSAVITWLLPTTFSPRDKFDPSTYILGPEEDLPRPMECFEFVSRASSEYFKSKNAPYPTKSLQPELGYIWTRFGPEIRPLSSMEDVNDNTLVEIDDSDKDKDNSVSGKGAVSEKRAAKRKQNDSKSGIKKEKTKTIKESEKMSYDVKTDV